jgi:protein-tyrosine phosphatase
VLALQGELDRQGIALRLIAGADVHVVPDLASRLADGSLPCLAGTRYFLFEPPHHVVPPGLLRVAQDAIAAGFIPILTHPERLTWIENAYELICELDEAGLAVQLTAGSVTGAFGERAQRWSQRMLDEGRVDIIASDAHDPRRRPPVLSRAREMIAGRYGEEAAARMTLHNPGLIIANSTLPKKHRSHVSAEGPKRRVLNFKKIFGFE